MKLDISRSVRCMFLCMVFVVTTAFGDPTNKLPTNPLNLHSKIPDAIEIYKQAISAEAELKALADKPPESMSEKEMGKGYTLLQQILWQAENLSIYGEPVSRELTLRSAGPGGKVANAARIYFGTPKGQAYREKLVAFLNNPKAVTARQRVLDQITKLVQQQKYVEAEKQIAGFFMEAWPYMVFLSASERDQIFRPADLVAEQVRPAMTQLRRQTAEKAFQASDQELSQRKDQFLKLSENAATEIRSGGTIAVNGQPLPGPAAINALSKQWGELHQLILKLAALDWALHRSQQERWGTDVSQLTAAMQKTISEVIAAEATVVPPPVARERYFQYLQLLSQLCGHVNSWKPESSFSEPLGQLATRGEMGPAVTGYSRATAELLRWRNKVATAQRANIQTGFTPIVPEMRKRLTSRQDYEGLYQENDSQTLPALLHSPYEVTPHVMEQMMKLKVIAPQVVGFDGTIPYLMSRYHDGAYGFLPKIRPVSGPAGLMNDLLVDADHPPLSLLTAAAIGSASRNEFEWVGGEVVGVEISGYVTRFVGMPPEARNVVSRDQMAIAVDPNGSRSGDILNLLVLQFSIMPEWVAHRYFVSKAELAKQSPPATPSPTATTPTVTENETAAAPSASPGEPPVPSETPSLTPSVVPEITPALPN